MSWWLLSLKDITAFWLLHDIKFDCLTWLSAGTIGFIMVSLIKSQSSLLLVWSRLCKFEGATLL